MTQRGYIDAVASGDIENSFPGFKRKFIAIDNDNILIGHDDLHSPL
jgi:hypothetical protein